MYLILFNIVPQTFFCLQTLFFHYPKIPNPPAVPAAQSSLVLVSISKGCTCQTRGGQEQTHISIWHNFKNGLHKDSGEKTCWA